MTVWIKEGVLGTLHREARRGLGKLETRFGTVYVTSKGEGEHMPGSLHYDCKAIDCRFDEDEIGATKADVIECLGPGFDVVEYSMHFHWEWDPKEVTDEG